MSHAFTLALVYALVLGAAVLLHAAAAGWVATRRVTVEPLTLIGAPVAAAVGMALLVDAVTAANALDPAALAASDTLGWLSPIGWLGGPLLLFLALLRLETGRLGRRWRAMGANAQGLVAIGVPLGPALPASMGLVLAGLAGQLAPAPTPTDWLPLACLGLIVLALPGRPRGWATQAVLLGWLAGALLGSLELVLDAPGHTLAVAASVLVIGRLAAPRLRRHGVG